MPPAGPREGANGNHENRGCRGNVKAGADWRDTVCGAGGEREQRKSGERKACLDVERSSDGYRLADRTEPRSCEDRDAQSGQHSVQGKLRKTAEKSLRIAHTNTG